MRSNTYLKLESIYKKYKGYVETKELMREGFSNRQIAALADEGYLEKICHGHYWLAGGRYEKPMDYKCIEVCLSNPRAVICMNSAIYYQGVIAKEPEYLSVATERTDRSLMKMNFLIKRHYFSENNFHMGMGKRNTEFGSYNIYNIERSICDLLRMDQEIGVEIKDYVKRSMRQNEILLIYIEKLKIRQAVNEFFNEVYREFK